MTGTTTTRLRITPASKSNPPQFTTGGYLSNNADMIEKIPSTSSFSVDGIRRRVGNAHFWKWTATDAAALPRCHPVLCTLATCFLLFIAVEYTIRMIPPTEAPYDVGFAATVTLHRLLAERPALNTLLAGLNTVFVAMITSYILATWLIEGRPRATISALFMFTCRGILGYATQLPLPHDFLGSGVDFPVGNVSFFLFYSGHVGAAFIASMDMKRTKRWELAYLFDTLNVLQVIRLLTTRGHYTIDLAAGVGAGMLFDYLAGKYQENRTTTTTTTQGKVCNGA